MNLNLQVLVMKGLKTDFRRRRRRRVIGGPRFEKMGVANWHIQTLPH
jgi:hypothetical protein